MPKLSEYLGSIVSSFTNSRVMSDIQTVRVAEEYANHHLLKHFSVPRMRFGDIEMTIPIALDEIEERTETEYESINHKEFNAIVYNSLIHDLKLSKISNEFSTELINDIANRTKILEQNIRLIKDLFPLQNYIKELISVTFYLSKKYQIKDNFDTNIKEISERLESEFSKEIKILDHNKSISNLNIIVEAHKLREQKPENLIYIKLKITEEGMEWNRTEYNNGEIEAKLLPE